MKQQMMPGSLQALKIKNRKRIIKLLRSKEMSSSEISRELKLSIAGTASLVDELVEDGILIKEHVQKKGRGRNPLNLIINGKYGSVAIIDFSEQSVVYIHICDLKGEVQYREKMLVSGQTFLLSLVDKLKLIVSENEYNLYAICVASKGKIKKDSGEIQFASLDFNYKLYNIKEIFFKEFKVPVEIKNSIVYSLEAEMRYNENIVSDYVMYVHNVGCAFSFNGKIYEGCHGYAGELGFMVIDIYDEIKNDGFFNSYKSNKLYSAAGEGLRSIVYNHCVNDLFAGKRFEDVTDDDLIDAYLSGNHKVVIIINRFIKIYSLAIKNIVDIMDLNQVVLGGFIKKLGHKALSIFYENFSGQSCENTDVNISFSKVKNSVLKGAVCRAVDLAYDTIL